VSDHLLDTDSIVDYLAGFVSTVDFLDDLLAVGDRFLTCDVVIAEIYAGLRPEREAAAMTMLQHLGFLPTSLQAARQAGVWRYAFARTGVPLATTDCLIAATAFEHGATVVTGNVKDFPMPGVTILPLPRVRR
jgi:predicted nucleic acid-binding protein